MWRNYYLFILLGIFGNHAFAYDYQDLSCSPREKSRNEFGFRFAIIYISNDKDDVHMEYWFDEELSRKSTLYKRFDYSGTSENFILTPHNRNGLGDMDIQLTKAEEYTKGWNATFTDPVSGAVSVLLCSDIGHFEIDWTEYNKLKNILGLYLTF